MKTGSKSGHVAAKELELLKRKERGSTFQVTDSFTSEEMLLSNIVQVQ
jgi:hypothetical protein